MKYKLEDFLLPVEVPEPFPATEREILEEQIAALRKQVEVYQRTVEQVSHSYNDWFARHLSRLCEEAERNFSESLVRRHLDAVVREQGLQSVVEKAVEGVFQKEANELVKAIYNAIVNRIQPYALKPR